MVDRLRKAAGEGQIDLDELEQRIAATYEARTLPDLVPLTADLPEPETARPPAPSAPTERPSVFDDAGFRAHFTCYALVMIFLIGIWLMTGAGYFWPFFPGAGWGIAIGLHWQSVVAIQRHRERKQQSRPGLPPSRSTHSHGHGRSDDRRRAEKLARRAEQLERRARRHAERGPAPSLPAPPPAPESSPPAAASTPAASSTSTPGEPAGDTEVDQAPARRFVVAMFVDVVNSTQLTEALGDERWASVRRSLQKLVDECVTRRDGWKANTAGDGLLLRFEWPQDAAQAAVDILRRLRQQQEETGFAPSVRIGIHSGDAMDEGQDIIGRVVNLTARVAAAADPDQILCTEHVADHLDDSLHTVGQGLHTLKGVPRPRHLLAVDWR